MNTNTYPPNVFVLSRINKALRGDFHNLMEAEKEVESMLSDARTFCEREISGLRDEDPWNAAWDEVNALLGDIHLYMTTLRNELEADTNAPLSSFDEVIERDATLHDALADVGAEVDERWPDPQRRETWYLLWGSLHSQLDIIRAYLAGARARIEMRRSHGVAESEALHQEMLGYLPPDAALGDAEQFAEEYEAAFQQFQRDKHRMGGLVDVFKALLLIQEEGPEAKIRRRLREKAEQS